MPDRQDTRPVQIELFLGRVIEKSEFLIAGRAGFGYYSIARHLFILDEINYMVKVAVRWKFIALQVPPYR